ncbi:MAG: hypothetical protein MHM6MM_003888 [Cercozoa sp. M6MM]
MKMICMCAMALLTASAAFVHAQETQDSTAAPSADPTTAAATTKPQPPAECGMKHVAPSFFIVNNDRNEATVRIRFDGSHMVCASDAIRIGAGSPREDTYIELLNWEGSRSASFWGVVPQDDIFLTFIALKDFLRPLEFDLRVRGLNPKSARDLGVEVYVEYDSWNYVAQRFDLFLWYVQEVGVRNTGQDVAALPPVEDNPNSFSVEQTNCFNDWAANSRDCRSRLANPPYNGDPGNADGNQNNNGGDQGNDGNSVDGGQQDNSAASALSLSMTALLTGVTLAALARN